MKTYSLEDHELLGWKILSFFSLDPESQSSLFGEADEWFCIEKDSIHKEANYLFGCRVVATMYAPSLADKFGSSSTIKDFVEALEELPPCSETTVWSKSALGSSHEWRHVRLAAQLALGELGLHCNPPKQPLRIQELIEIGTFRVNDDRKSRRRR